MEQVQAMSAEEQVKAVSKKLVELNPGFDGKVMPIIENDIVKGITLSNELIVDISPIRTLVGLKTLNCG